MVSLGQNRFAMYQSDTAAMESPISYPLLDSYFHHYYNHQPLTENFLRKGII